MHVVEVELKVSDKLKDGIAFESVDSIRIIITIESF